jgi:type I restriction enzyme, R subunit
MSDQTKERAFELHVEETLLGQGGWRPGTNAEWDVDRALFPARVVAFLEATQPKLWSEMRAPALTKELDLKGRSMSSGTASSSTARPSGWPISGRRTG